MSVQIGSIVRIFTGIIEEVSRINKAKVEIGKHGANVFDDCVERAINIITGSDDSGIFSEIKTKYENSILVDDLLKKPSVVEFLKNNDNKNIIKNLARNNIIYEKNISHTSDYNLLESNFSNQTLEDVGYFQPVINLTIAFVRYCVSEQTGSVMGMQEIIKKIPIADDVKSEDTYDVLIKYELVDHAIPINSNCSFKFQYDIESIKYIVNRLNVDLPCKIKVNVIESDFYQKFINEKLLKKHSDGFDWSLVREKNILEVTKKSELINFIINNFIKAIRENFAGDFGEMIKNGFNVIGNLSNSSIKYDKIEYPRIIVTRKKDNYSFQAFVPHGVRDAVGLSYPVHPLQERYLNDFENVIISSYIIVGYLYHIYVNKYDMHEFWVHDFIWSDV